MNTNLKIIILYLISILNLNPYRKNLFLKTAGFSLNLVLCNIIEYLVLKNYILNIIL